MNEGILGNRPPKFALYVCKHGVPETKWCSQCEPRNPAEKYLVKMVPGTRELQEHYLRDLVRLRGGLGPIPESAEPPFKRSPQQDVLLALPEDAAARKATPVCTGVLDYFPAAIAEVAQLSKKGNDQHNPGEALHWARGKSTDQADTIVRHLMQRGTIDTDGIRHSAKVAWRALALLQEEIEREAGFVPKGGAK